MELARENEIIFRIWALCSKHGRDGISGNLQLSTVLDVCRAYDLTTEVFEKVLEFEVAVYPFLSKAESKTGQDLPDEQ